MIKRLQQFILYIIQKIGLPISILFPLLFLSYFISSCTFLNNIEKLTVDFRILLRGERTGNASIALILVDQKTVNQLGTPPYADEYVAQIANTLNRLGAKTIGLDFTLVTNNEQAQELFGLIDSASFNTNAVREVIPFLTQHYAQGAGSDTCPTSFLSQPQILQQSILPDIIRKDEKAAHNQKIPLFFIHQQKYYSTFLLKVLESYYDLSDSQITRFNSKIIIEPDGQDFIEIPTTENHEVYLNQIGTFSNFKNIFSFSEIYSLSNKIAKAETVFSDYSVFKNKIILIGKTYHSSTCETPFCDYLPKIFLQATLLSNILNQDFLYYATSNINLIILICLAILCIFLFTRQGTIRKIVSFACLLSVLWIFSIILFLFWGFIVELTMPAVFLLLSCFGVIIFDEYRREHGRNPFWRQNQTGNFIPEKDSAFGLDCGVKPFVKIVIPIIKLRDECIISHTIETDKDRLFGLSAFHRSPQTKHPYIFRRNKINRLLLEQEQLGDTYYSNMKKNPKSMIKPIDILKRVGQRVYQEFGLATTFDELFKLETQNVFLNIVIDDPSIPWQWAYHSASGTFLCEKFPVSLSFAIEKADLTNSHLPQKIGINLSAGKSSVLLYGNWSSEPKKALKEVEKEISSIQRRIVSQEKSSAFICTDTEVFLKTLDNSVKQNKNLRIIHYSGHIENDRLDVSPKQYLQAGTIKYTKNLYFYSRPVVFLNGCKSGNLGYLWDKYDDLATEFLACGAAACIITHFDIVETTARKFSVAFYEYFVKYRFTVGESLQKARLGLGKTSRSEKYDPEYDITRYFYNLYGDPTVTF